MNSRDRRIAARDVKPHEAAAGPRDRRLYAPWELV
jgi:hypothetical protein